MQHASAFYDDYRNYLKEAYEARRLRNSGYSLRAYARDLGIAVSTLTELLNGKYGLSKTRASLVAKNLSLSGEQADHFADLMTMTYARKPSERGGAKIRVRERLRRTSQAISADAFKVIADWYHFAILELTNLQDFDPSPLALSKRLGISETVVVEAIARLKKLNLIEASASGFCPTGDFSAVGNGESAHGIRQFHKQVLERAITAIDRQPVDTREFSSTVFSFRKKDMPLAKKQLLKFRTEFAKKFVTPQHADDVVCLSVQFFSLLERT